MEHLINPKSITKSRTKELFGLALLLILTSSVIQLFHIEYLSGFDQFFPFIAAAIFLHNVLPYPLRKYFFSIWSLLLLFISTDFITTAIVFVIICFATSITFIPQKKYRNLTALLLFVVLITIRLFISTKYDFTTAISIAGIFIMLRFIFLLYEISFIKTKPSFLIRLNYLFMLPNIFFPLFPIIDPLQFFKHKQEDIPEAHKLGKTWLSRGIIQLLAYRFIYLYITPSIYELHNWQDLFSFICTGYALILRLSGIFYISVGILALMGYQLPAVFQNYFLAKNFSDLWTRINLYWRHFMLRVFYYPMLLQLKKWRPKRAILLLMLTMFAITWLLHSWQWYWIKGSFPILPNDILYWSIFGTIIAVVSVNKFSKNKKTSHDNHFKIGMGVVAMFFAMSILWSLWTATSLTEWMYIFSKFSKLETQELIYFAATVVGLFLIGGVISKIHSRTTIFNWILKTPKENLKFILLSILVTAGLLLTLGYDLPNYSLAKMTRPQLNGFDRMLVERGYYEQLLTTQNISKETNSIFKKTEQKDFQNPAYQKTNGLLDKKLKPTFETIFKEKLFSTNSFGMRDKEYALQCQPNIYRICLLGASYEMGSGVGNGEPFEQLIEDSLNHSKLNTEILNMGVGGYSILQLVKMVDSNCLTYNPNAIAIVCHSSEKQRMLEQLLNLITKNKDLEYTYITNIIQQSGINATKMCRAQMYDLLLPHADSLLSWAYSHIETFCSKNQIIPIWIYLPSLGDLRTDTDLNSSLRFLKTSKFQIINLNGLFDGHDLSEITVSSEDTHPNAIGHQIIAKKLYLPLRNTIHSTNNKLK